MALYGLGHLAAVGMAKLLKRTLLRGETPVFLLELPRYQWPSLRTAAYRVLERIGVLRTAGTLIVAVSVITWDAMYYPRNDSPRESYLGQVGQVIEPIVRPLGMGLADWVCRPRLVPGEGGGRGDDGGDPRELTRRLPALPVATSLPPPTIRKRPI